LLLFILSHALVFSALNLFDDILAPLIAISVRVPHLVVLSLVMHPRVILIVVAVLIAVIVLVHLVLIRIKLCDFKIRYLGSLTIR